MSKWCLFCCRSSSLNEGQPSDSARFNNESGESGDRSGGGGGNANNNFDRPPLSVGSGNGDNCSNSELVNCKDAPAPASSSNFEASQVGGDANVCRRRGRPPSTNLVPTDLRIKLEPLHATGLRGDELSAATYKELKQVAAAAAAAAAGNDKEIAASLWNSTTKQAAHKGGSVATPDGMYQGQSIIITAKTTAWLSLVAVIVRCQLQNYNLHPLSFIIVSRHLTLCTIVETCHHWEVGSTTAHVNFQYSPQKPMSPLWKHASFLPNLDRAAQIAKLEEKNDTVPIK